MVQASLTAQLGEIALIAAATAAGVGLAAAVARVVLELLVMGVARAREGRSEA